MIRRANRYNRCKLYYRCTVSRKYHRNLYTFRRPIVGSSHVLVPVPKQNDRHVAIMIDRDLFVSRNLTDVSPYFLRYAHHCDSIKIPSFAFWSKYLGAKVFLSFRFSSNPRKFEGKNFSDRKTNIYAILFESVLRLRSRNHYAIQITSCVTDTPSFLATAFKPSFEIKFTYHSF